MYARELEMRILKARLSRKHGGMWEFARLLARMRAAKHYKKLGYESFADWIVGSGLSKSTIYTWINLRRAYSVERGIQIESLEAIEVRILKCFLPLARSDQIQTHELWEEIIAAVEMGFHDFQKKLPGIKRHYGITSPRQWSIWSYFANHFSIREK